MLFYWVVAIFRDKESKGRDKSQKISPVDWGNKILYEAYDGINDGIMSEEV